MNWYFEVLKKYAVFEGRARRKEYWFFQLFQIIVTMVLAIIGALLISVNSGLEHAGSGLVFVDVLIVLYGLATLLPGLAVLVRRLHDTNRSGWMIFLGLIPLVGGIILLVFAVEDGTPGPNQYGPDPKQRDVTFAAPPVMPANYAPPYVPPMAQAAGAGMSQQSVSQAPPAAFCSGCGRPLVAGSHFCAACGRAV